MRARTPILPHRLRRIPPQFSWVDHRLVREGHLQGRSPHALALYLFLVTVADAHGLSWYADDTLCRQLSCSAMQLHRARTELEDADLIAYRAPLYQVLDLPSVSAASSPEGAPPRAGRPLPIAAMLPRLLTAWAGTADRGGLR